MTAFFRKYSAWLSVVFLIAFVSFSLDSKAGNDAAIDFALLVSTQGNQQNEDMRRLIRCPTSSPGPRPGPPAGTPGYRPRPPAGTPGYRPEHPAGLSVDTEDSIGVQSHPLSEPSQEEIENMPSREQQREMDRE